jgi:hypothetical protein
MTLTSNERKEFIADIRVDQDQLLLLLLFVAAVACF